MDIDFGFAHLYDIEDVPELPGSGSSQTPLFYFPRPITRPEHDGAYVKIVPETGNSWIGVFRFGYSCPSASSKILSLPDPERLCVISEGAGYIVASGDPERWEALELMPITNAHSVPAHGLIVFGNFTRLVAHDGNQIVWKSPRLCWDDLRITEIDDDVVKGVGHDPTSESESQFAVDIKTGRSLLPSPLSIDGRPVW